MTTLRYCPALGGALSQAAQCDGFGASWRGRRPPALARSRWPSISEASWSGAAAGRPRGARGRFSAGRPRTVARRSVPARCTAVYDSETGLTPGCGGRRVFTSCDDDFVTPRLSTPGAAISGRLRALRTSGGSGCGSPGDVFSHFQSARLGLTGPAGGRGIARAPACAAWPLAGQPW